VKPLDLNQIASLTGGEVHGDEGVIAHSVVIDSRNARPGVLFAAFVGENVDGHDYVDEAFAAGAVAVLAERVVTAPCVVVDNVTVALGALASENLRGMTAPVVGITGSQGKTSVKDLLAHVLEAAGTTVAPVGSFNNEIGVPLTVLRADASTQFLILEMGARGQGHISTLCHIARPDVGVVLNVGNAHLGEFGSVEAISRAKGELVESLPESGVAVLNADDPLVVPMRERTVARVLTFGTSGDVMLGPISLDDAGEPHFELAYDGVTVDVHIPQMGEHHGINAAAATAAALAVGVDLPTIATRLSSAVAASAMRMERHVRRDGLVVINDAYNANPESMAAALRAAAAIGRGRVVAVLGEMLELGADSRKSHREIGELAAELGVARVIVVGEGAKGIAEGAGSIAETVPDVYAAVEVLSASLHPDDVVLVKASRGCRLERVADALLVN